MPLAWRLQVLEARVRETGVAVTVEDVNLYALGREDQHVVLDALVAAGGDLPAVMVGERVVCVDGIDLEAVLESLTEFGRA